MNKDRSYLAIWNTVYILAAALTVAIVLWIGLPFGRIYNLMISIGALIVAESAIYGVILYSLLHSRRFQKQVPGFLGYGTVAVLYFLAAFVIVLLFSPFHSVFSYFIIHAIAFMAAAILFGVVAVCVKYIERQEQDTKVQTQLIKEMQLTISAAKRNLEMCDVKQSDLLRKLVHQLEEKVKYSDPVTHASLFETDQLLLEQMRELEDRFRLLNEVEEPYEETAKLGRSIEHIEHLLEQRNRRLIQLK
ncbi:hypothetical protein PAE9249_04785 [Paenibacillus sp. CECT 9249]|uniref:DUF677 domain-containing protein n=1 Tax=Paenibacillus sp. CECT 9249 TaxID=2845385 RepID=UPI001E3E9D3C|nr:DUF677 domain-containing protein [Paenibacillus sp. CECT 9249]CAH0122237.1 hypothetical protein PAE9249_04785 [Paenibacillus sp. CECT 9249]